MQKLKAIYLIRHGETPWSLSGQHTSRSDIPLTAHGEAQARALGETLREVHFDHVFSSPAARARRTCVLANLPNTVGIDDDLREWDYGDYEGLRSDDIAKSDPNWSLWNDGGLNGESPDAVAARCDRLLKRLSELDGTIALFAHGHICCAIATRWIGLPIAQGEHLILDAASTSILGFPEHHRETRAIQLWNAPSGAKK